MRLWHIAQTWDGIKNIGDLRTYLFDCDFHVPRLCHLLWSGYVREATRAVDAMLYRLFPDVGPKSQAQAVLRIGEEPSDLSDPERNLDSRLLPTIPVGTTHLEFTG